MKSVPIYIFIAVFFLSFSLHAQGQDKKILARTILSDARLDTVQRNALKLLTSSSAGTSYREIWIRDFNTFIKGALKVQSKDEVRNILLMFFKIQGLDGNIVDGVVQQEQAKGGYDYRYSDLLPGWAAHKNTVETDQESSLVQALRKYIEVTNDRTILTEMIGGKSVLQRIEDAFLYIRKERWSAQYGLVTGATTIDWGDVQPETGWGVAINNKTKMAIDIYDNAMYVMAIHDFLAIKPEGYHMVEDWKHIADQVKKNVRKHLWMKDAKKYKPHIYLNGSPFSKNFDEDKILYSGGSICAILAGFNTRSEVAAINQQIVDAAKKEKYATIGMTVYPPYPVEEFPNMPAYVYQNAGDWTWFGGRMMGALVSFDMVKEAYNELLPMVDRTISHKGFFEWYDVRTGAPKGSGSFRGEAGVLYDAITVLKKWAAEESTKK